MLADRETLRNSERMWGKGKYSLVWCIKESKGKQVASETPKKLFLKFALCLSRLPKHHVNPQL